MAWKPAYATLAEFKAHLTVQIPDTDTPLQAALDAASRAVDYECDRQFGSAVQTRYYDLECGLVLDGCNAVAIDDIMTTSGLLVAYDNNADGTWSQATTMNGDWSLWPYNAPSDGLPWTHLVQRNYPTSTYPFPWSSQGIRVTGTFGWVSVPAVVVTATLIQASRFFVRRDSAYGVAGSPDLGNELRLQDRLDPDVALLLKSVKRRWGAV